MTNLLELRSRAALCRQFAEQEPASKAIWLAEAERWSRLAQDRTSLHDPEYQATSFAAGAGLDSYARQD
jgi:hypothetical protein